MLLLGSSKGDGGIEARFSEEGDSSIAFQNRDHIEGARLGAVERGGLLVLESATSKGMIFALFSKARSGPNPSPQPEPRLP